MARRTGADGTHLAQRLALLIGAAYTLAGLAGFLVTGFDQFAEKTGETLLGLEVNPLHNIVHLVIGIAGLVMAKRLDMTRAYGWLLFVGYGATFVYGLFAVDDDDINFLSINNPDNVLHIVSALAGLAIALLAQKRLQEARAATSRTVGTGGRVGAR
jgi:uncharacterized membrane protein YuzA (DUF378 family)